MSNAFFGPRVIAPVPQGYVAPPFPALYWPFPIYTPRAQYLYHASDIWRYTLVWTLIFFGAMHMVAAGYAVLMHARSLKIVWVVPVVYAVVGGCEAFIGGSCVGGLLAAVYNSGNFRMSTWIPFVWGIINSLVLILSSFAIQGAL